MAERKIETVVLWSRTAHLASARRQGDGRYEGVKRDGARATALDDKAPRWHVYTSVDNRGADAAGGAKTEIISARSEQDDGLLSIRCSNDKAELIVD